MKLITSLVLASSISLFSSVAVAIEPSYELRYYCKPIVNANIEGDNVELDNSFGAGYCFGVFQTLNNISSNRVKTDDKALSSICIPKNTPTSQLIKVFIKFTEDIPPTILRNYYDLALQSLTKEYPCK